MTSPVSRRSNRQMLDLLGVGFGPANMALAVLLEELEEDGEAASGTRRLFLEAKSDQAWHPGMLLEGSLLQITALKDLAMVRNPRSRFTFLNYLHDQDRLFDFLNLRDLFPTRAEFNDYLGWIARELAQRVLYGRRVTAVEPVVGDDGEVGHLAVEVHNGGSGETEHYETRNLAVAIGGRPWAPDGIEIGGRVIHSHQFLPRLRSEFPDRDRPYRFVVAGAGQSGAELFDYLMTHYPAAQVTATMRGFGYKPVDESDFTNEIFFPRMVDFVFDLPDEDRRRVVDSFRDVNYAVVDAPLIRKIYRRLYDQKVEGAQRGRLRPYLGLRRVTESADGVEIEFEHLLERSPVRMEADALILATGYRWTSRLPLLEPLAPHLECGEDGEYRIERDYGISSRSGFRPRIYLQGHCEPTHGISETVLSLLPMRAQDIWKSLSRRLEKQRLGTLTATAS